MNKTGIKGIVKLIAGKCFEDFQDSYAPEVNSYYTLDVKLLVNALYNAMHDIDRVANYHSKTGADLYRQTAFITKWIAEIKPIQTQSFPVNLNNNNLLNMQRINASFATYIADYMMLVEKQLSPALLLDLRYCFEFRHSMPAEAIALILKHYQPNTTENS